jgi:hypothetical protein
MLARRYAPATQRNRDYLLAILQRVLPTSGTLLEIASGSGEHAAFFGPHFPQLQIQPTDVDAEARASIDAWCGDIGNVHPALVLDAAVWPWPIDAADAILCVNMIHIAPPEACEGLLQGASNILPPGAPLLLYGPYRENGVHTADSNARFDQDLQRRDPRWGVRDLDAVLTRAAELGLTHEETITMPANNRTVILRRRG